MMKTFSAAVLLFAVFVNAQDAPCNPESRTFTVKLNLFAGELGTFLLNKYPNFVVRYR